MRKIREAGALGLAVVLLGLAACVGEVGNGELSVPGRFNLGNLCTDRFDPSKAAGGEDCTPVYNRFCPSPGVEAPTNQADVPYCAGVTVTRSSVTVAGIVSNYIVLTPVTGGRAGLYVGLHWVGGNAETMIGRMRLSELALGRDLTVVVPTAPGTPATWGFDIAPAVTELTTRVQLLDAVIAAVKQQTGLQDRVWMSGLSGGGVMAYEYACQRASAVAGVEAVAAEIQPSTLQGCSTDQAFVNVQVHGTLDTVAPYAAVPGVSAGVESVYASALANNGCDAGRESVANLPSQDTFVTGIAIRFTPGSECGSGTGSALVTIAGGGHNWPGYDDPLGLGLGINGYGPTCNSFDATLQGYDLMRYLGG